MGGKITQNKMYGRPRTKSRRAVNCTVCEKRSFIHVEASQLQIAFLERVWQRMIIETLILFYRRRLFRVN